MTTRQPVMLASLSAAMDGGFIAIADVSGAMSEVGAADDYRLIGDVAVLLHVQRLGLDLPLRATGDADFGVPPYVLRKPELVPRSKHSATKRPPAIDGNAPSTIGGSRQSTYWFPRTRRGSDIPSEWVRS
jgi:hypothetical protein